MDNFAKLNVQTLAQRTYERSKFWAGIIEQYSQDSSDVLDLENIENELANYVEEFDDEDENDTMNSEDEALECEEDEDDEDDDDILMDITNYSIIKCENPADRSFNKYALVDGYGNIETNSKIQNILNQTLPIINEHQRQLRESGVDRVLCTFNAKEIERTVGGWLRSYQSQRPLRKIDYFPTPQSHWTPQPRNDSDSESLHSIETAEYIRSSRKQNYSNKKKSCSSATMTIKTFRTVKSKRDALREKYAFAEHDEHHLEEIRMRRRLRKFDDQYGCEEYSSYIETQQRELIKKRRKQLRKRRSTNTSSTTEEDMEDTDDDISYSSVNDCAAHQCRNCHSCGNRSLKKPKQKSKCHMVHCQRGLQASFKTPRCSKYNALQNHKQIRSGKKCKEHNRSSDYCDERPCRQVTECHCCENKYLCKSYRHIANSSCDVWMVDNCQTPLSNKTIEAKMDILNSIKAQTMSLRKPRMKAKRVVIKQEIESEIEISDTDCEEIVVKKERSIDKSIKRKSKSPKQITTEADDNDSFNKELQKAIKASKAQYRQEQKDKLKETNEAAATTTTKTNKTRQITSAAMERTLKPQPKCSKLRKLVKHAEDSSFLSNASEIYNSTALANHSTAKKKQFGKYGKDNKNKVSSHVSTTNVDGDAEPVTKSVAASNDDENDCTIVTSTTENNAMANEGNVSANVTAKGIIIYKPKKRTSSANTNSGRGFFNVTQEHLSAVIGERSARKFFKYYVGRRQFDGNSTIYYRPPEPIKTSWKGHLQLAKADSNAQTNTDTESDDDILDCINQYGELYESPNKSN